MPVIAYIMNMKWHNGIHPCHACYIAGVWNAADGQTTYYPAIIQPGTGVQWDIQSLLTDRSQSYETFVKDVKEIQELAESGSRAAYERAQKDTGINGWSVLLDIGSIDFG